MNGVVFGINRKQRDVVPGNRSHDHFAGGDQHFLVREGDIFAMLDGFVGGGQSDNADGGGNDGLRVGMSGDSFDPFGTKQNFQRFNF